MDLTTLVQRPALAPARAASARPRALPCQGRRARAGLSCRASLAPDTAKPSPVLKVLQRAARGARIHASDLNKFAPDGNGATPAPGLPSYDDMPGGGSGKQRILVLGSGWGSMSFVKAFDESLLDKYELVVVSPRNYFVYTPLLPAMCAGTVEERSIVEPVRSFIAGKGKFFEAKCTEILPEERAIVACFPEDAGFPEACFKVPYDILILAVGCVNNTFGIAGVAEYTNFFKSLEDAVRLRLRISECFERAALPQTTSEERKKLLSFVIVGGGPTGVEVAAELHDLIVDDLAKLYPDEVGDVKIKVVELMDHVLSTYDRAIGAYTADTFRRNNIDLVLESRVARVGPDAVTVVNKEGQETDIPFGACVWATGIAKHPLVNQLQERLPAGSQTHFRSIVTDEFLRVRGSNGSMFALGDAATIEQQKALDKAAELFEDADVNKDGKLQLSELQELMRKASEEFPHLAEHARFLDGKYGSKRFGGMVGDFFAAASKKNAADSSKVFKDVNESAELDREQLQELLRLIDSGLRALPATAQVAKQEGEYLAQLFKENDVAAGQSLKSTTKPFEYLHKGSLAYVGSDRAVMDVPLIGPIVGIAAGLAWRGFETFSQISFRNQVLVATDWVRMKVFGRDTSRV